MEHLEESTYFGSAPSATELEDGTVLIVGDGVPTLRVTEMTIGGTAA